MILIKGSAMLKSGVRGRMRKQNRRRKRVVILGGGFAGVYTARRFERKIV